MKATVEPVEGNKVKLLVEVPEEEFDGAVGQAFTALARQVRIPGFRPGKVPRKVLEKRIGVGAAREEAVRQSLPEYFAQAALDTDTDAIAPPEIDITSGLEDGPLVFSATVEIRQSVEISDFSGLKVTVPVPFAEEAEIDAQIDRLRSAHGTLEAVDRPAVDGDRVRIDISGTHDGEPVAGLTADDYVYEVGSAAVVPELDVELRGAKPGDILEFAAAVPGGDDDTAPLQLRVLVKEVSALVLPELTDTWVADATEFDTVQELRLDISNRMGEIKKVNAILALRNGVVDAVADLVTDEPAEALVNLILQERLHDLQHRLEDQGLTLQQYFASTGRPPEEIQAELNEGATRAARADLGIRALIRAEGLEATDDELTAEIVKAAERTGDDPDEIRARLESDDRMQEVRFDISRSKAVDWLIEHVEVIDPSGASVDRSLLQAPDQPLIDDSHDHDHDHDHDHGHDHDESGESQ